MIKIELTTAKAWLRQLEDVGNRYRLGGDLADQAQAEFARLKDKFIEMQDQAARNSDDEHWARVCAEIPVALRGADQLWLTVVERRRWLDDALHAARRLRDDQAAGFCIGGIGNLLTDQGKHREALSYFRERLVIAEQHQQRGAIVKTLLNLGNSHLRLQEYDLAIDLLSQSLSHARTWKMPQDEARCLNSLAVMSARTGDLGTAIEYMKRRIAILETAPDTTQLASSYGNLGGWLTDMGNLEEAKSWLEKALAMHKSAESAVGMALVTAKMAQREEAGGDIQLALTLMNRAAEILDEANAQDLLHDCQAEVARLQGVRQSDR